MDGWPAVRLAVFRRDRGCIAVNQQVFGADTAPDLCANKFGTRIDPADWDLLEFDHVKEGLGGPKAPDDEAHGVAVCPWHHRLSSVWRSDSALHRLAERAWLARHYPAVWGQ